MASNSERQLINQILCSFSFYKFKEGMSLCLCIYIYIYMVDVKVGIYMLVSKTLVTKYFLGSLHGSHRN